MFTDKVGENAWVKNRVFIFGGISKKFIMSVLQILLKHIHIIFTYHSVHKSSFHFVSPHSCYIINIVSVILCITSLKTLYNFSKFSKIELIVKFLRRRRKFSIPQNSLKNWNSSLYKIISLFLNLFWNCS